MATAQASRSRVGYTETQDSGTSAGYWKPPAQLVRRAYDWAQARYILFAENTEYARAAAKAAGLAWQVNMLRMAFICRMVYRG